MSGRRPERDRDPDEDRVKFPFGHSVEGDLDQVLSSDAGPLDDDDSDELPLGSDVGRVVGDAPATRLPAPPPPPKVEYASEEGPVRWAPRFPGAKVPPPAPALSSEADVVIPDSDVDAVRPGDDEDGPLEELTASEVGRIIDAQETAPKRLFDPIPEDPARSKRLARESGRAPARQPSGRTPRPPASGSQRRPPEHVARSEAPTQSVDPALVPLPPGVPRSETPTEQVDPRLVPRSEEPTQLAGPPLPPRRREPVPASEAPTLHGDADRPAAPPTPSGRQLLATAPRPPATPSGAHAAAAAPLAGASGPPTLHTLVPARPAPLAPPTPEDLPTRAPAYGQPPEEPTQAPGYAAARDPFESDARREAPTAEQLAALERTHPESAGTFPSLQESGDAPPGSEPRGLVSGKGSARLVLDVSSGSSRFAAEPSSLASAPLSDESAMDELGRRTAEVEVPHVSRRRRLFEDSDITPIPDLPELFGSAEGPVTGALDSAEAPALPETASQRQLAPSLRLVRASVERVVGLWEGDTAWVLVSLGGAIVGPILLFLGWEYYGLPLPNRPGHPLHPVLRPGGSAGLVFGLAGSALFLLNLTYVLRRRLGLLRKWVSLRVWLNTHFICGLTGGSLILAHSALLANNDVARVSALAIAVAIVSGIFGRYVLSHLPRRRDGEGPDLAEREDVAGKLVELRRQLRARLARQPALRDVALSALATEAVSQVSGTGEDEPVHQKPRGILYLVPLVLGDVAAALRWVALSAKVRALARRSDDPQLKKLLNETLALARVQRLEQRMAQYDAVQDLMHTWRGVHFIVALIVIATMFLHVTIVLRHGRLDWLG